MHTYAVLGFTLHSFFVFICVVVFHISIDIECYEIVILHNIWRTLYFG